MSTPPDHHPTVDHVNFIIIIISSLFQKNLHPVNHLQTYHISVSGEFSYSITVSCEVQHGDKESAGSVLERERERDKVSVSVGV